jgi:microsomal dipeptidase-like Zn-dependent dipeptidase
MMAGGPLIVDAHCDAFERRQQTGVRYFGDAPGLPITLVGDGLEASLDNLREGDVGCIFLNMGDDGLAGARVRLEAAYAMCAAHPGDFAICRTAGDVREARATGQIAIVLSIEGMAMLQKDARLLQEWRERGGVSAEVSASASRIASWYRRAGAAQL